MAGKTVTRAQLSEAVYQEVGLSRNESADLVDAILDEISHSLLQDGAVKISSFGTFACARRASGSGATRRPARKCRSCRAGCWCSVPRMS